MQFLPLVRNVGKVIALPAVSIRTRGTVVLTLSGLERTRMEQITTFIYQNPSDKTWRQITRKKHANQPKVFLVTHDISSGYWLGHWICSTLHPPRDVLMS